jgi:DNA repair photolyase
MKNGNMYNFITKKWNPLGGECLYNCSYCYVKKMKKRFPVMKEKYSGDYKLLNYEYKKSFKKQDKIFVCNCIDLFASNVSHYLIEAIIQKSYQYESTFFFQSKNPDRFKFFSFPEKAILCTTIETNRYYHQIMGNSPLPSERMGICNMVYVQKQVTIEPIMDFDLEIFIDIIKTCNADQINIGADSGRNNLPEPSKEKILELINELEKFTKVVLKSNLNRLIK